jgi:acetyl esterase/lipase
MNATGAARLLRLARACALGATLLLGGCQGVFLRDSNRLVSASACVTTTISNSTRVANLRSTSTPRERKGAPVVVFFYGGSWLGGEREWYRFVGDALAAHGVVVAIPDYRKLPEVSLDGFMRDAARAVAWMHDHAADYGGDARRLFVMGHSSGGHIAALLATDPRWLARHGLVPRDLAGCIGLAGVYAFLPADVDDDEMLDVFGATPEERREAAPVAFVRGREPPMLLLSGDADREVDAENSRELATALRSKGERVEMRIYPGVGHSALLLALSHPLRSHAPTLHDVLAFVGAGMQASAMSHTASR